MNIVRTLRLLKHTVFLLSLVSTSLLLSACGGGSDNKTSTTSSSSSISSHVFSSRSVTSAGSGTWPDIKVSVSGTKTLKFEWTAPSGGASYYKLMKSLPNNDDAFAQIGGDTTELSAKDVVSVHLTDWFKTKYKVQACDASNNCVNSNAILADSAMINAIGYVKASNTRANAWFGWSVAVSGDGNTMAIGSPGESSNALGVNGNQNDTSLPSDGAVYVFVKENGEWVQQAYLKASKTISPKSADSSSSSSVPVFRTLPISRFGYQLALSFDGNTLAVSAVNESSPSSGVNCAEDLLIGYNNGTPLDATDDIYFRNYGAVYVFKRTDTTWVQNAYIKSFNATSNQQFGLNLAISGDGKTLAVATNLEDSLTAGIKMMDSASSTVCLDLSNSTSSSVSSTSSSVSISSTSSSKVGGAESGAVYIYHETNLGWGQEAFVKASNAATFDNFGDSLALSYDGNLLAVGASREDSALSSSASSASSATTIDSGAVYIFTRSNFQWSEQTKLKPSHNEIRQNFGYSLALSGDGTTLAVGTPGDWSKASGIADGTDAAAFAVKQTDYVLDVNASSPHYGSVYVFMNDGTKWVEKSYIKASNPRESYFFGFAVALSTNGKILAVGSPTESSAATGINGDEKDVSSVISGACYIFNRASGIWVQQSYVKAPVNHENDRFGHALALDGAGTSLFVGAHRESSNATGINGNKNDKSAPTAGAVYIY